MKIYTEEVSVSKDKLKLNALKERFSSLQNTPIRFVVTKSGAEDYCCEIDCVSGLSNFNESSKSIFDYSIRTFNNVDRFNAVLIIPTGIGADLGGHCGDGNAVARLVASACDTLITHPNVVNAADINEMTENTLYVEGSILTQFLMGQIGLQKVRANRVLMLMDAHQDRAFNTAIVNLASTARAILGIDCDVLQMEDKIICESQYSGSGKASGEIRRLEKLFDIIETHRRHYDAIGLSTFINMPIELITNYFKYPNVVNPWGGIEAMLTHSIAWAFDIPCAHAPMAPSLDLIDRNFREVEVIDPRKASESFSRLYLYSVVKGLHKSPRIVKDKGLTVEDVSCLIIPDGCIGLPTLAAIEQGIPIIAVRENKNLMQNRLAELSIEPGKLFIVDNYLEAVGTMTAIKAGVTPAAVRRPLNYTKVLSAGVTEVV